MALKEGDRYLPFIVNGKPALTAFHLETNLAADPAGLVATSGNINGERNTPHGSLEDDASLDDWARAYASSRGFKLMPLGM